MKQILLFFALFLPVCAFPQFYEPFEGPEIPSAWTGRREFFRILSPGTLQFDGGRKSGIYALATPIAYAETMQWETRVSFGFNPSIVNHARLYVYATARPSDILFYVQIGHNDDNVSLYQWKGSDDPVRVIAGRKKILDSDRPAVEVRLTMEEKGQLWTLYTRLPGEADFYREGTFRSAPLPDIQSEGNLMVACHCKAAGKEEALFQFGPVRVSASLSPVLPDPEPDPDNPDQPDDPDDPDDSDPDNPGGDGPGGDSSLPVFESVTPLDLSTLQFRFSRPVLIDKARFTISGIGTARRQTYADETRQLVNAGFAAQMQVGRSYTIAWEGVTDAQGKAIAAGHRDVSLEEGDDPGETPDDPGQEGTYPPGTLLINEVMADPKGLVSLPETEYVEIKNASASSVALKNWAFLYGGKAVLLEEAELVAGGYVVLYKAGRTLTPDAGGLAMPLDKFPALLANAGKELQLKDPAGNLIDQITYAKAKPAVSWERGDTGWHLSTDRRGGTPGSVNSPAEPESEDPENPEDPGKPGEDPEPGQPDAQPVFPGEIVFNELLPNPFEGGSEYIELYNRSERTLSLAMLSIATRKNDGSLSTRYPLSSVPFVLPPGGYVLLTKDAEGVASFYLVSAPEVVHALRLPVLANTSSTLVLFQTKGEKVIDEVSYAKAWHASWVKNEKGIALERIDPDRPTQEAANWTSASETAGYGTPGYRNSQAGSGRPETPTGIEAPVYSHLTGEYEINYYLDQPGYSCRAWIYDTAGRRLAEVANQTLLGREGRFTWDGRGADGARLRPGVYLFYADLYHEGGKTHAYKRVFLAY